MREMGQGMALPATCSSDAGPGRTSSAPGLTRATAIRSPTHLNAARKYVVSTTLDDAAAWQNSVLLAGDAVEPVTALKETDGPDLAIVGSASLVRSLHAAGLIDRYVLSLHPLVLGQGTRLFDESSPLTEFRLIRQRGHRDRRDHRQLRAGLTAGQPPA